MGASKKVLVNRELLQIVFDLVVNSMDFGSGFFDEDDVKATRELATIIGLDPMVGTPENMKCQFGAEHKPYPYGSGAQTTCMACHKVVDRK